MALTLQSSIAAFGAAAKHKLTNVAAVGEPEDQLRAPFERLLEEMAELAGISRKNVAAVGHHEVACVRGQWPWTGTESDLRPAMDALIQRDRRRPQVELGALRALTALCIRDVLTQRAVTSIPRER